MSPEWHLSVHLILWLLVMFWGIPIPAMVTACGSLIKL